MPRRGLLLTFDERRCQEIRNRLPICPALLQARKPDCFKYNLPDTRTGNRADVMQRREGASTPSLRVETIDQRRSEEHTSELQSLMRISYAVFCLTKNTKNIITP